METSLSVIMMESSYVTWYVLPPKLTERRGNTSKKKTSFQWPHQKRTGEPR